MLRVAAKTVVADGVVTLELAAPAGGRLPDWTPGSHIDLVLPERADPPVLAVRRPLGRRTPTGSACCASRPAAAGPPTSTTQLAPGRPRRGRRAAQQLPARAVAALPVRRRRHRHHPDPADGPPGRPARRRLAAALRRPPARLDGFPRRARGGYGDRVRVRPQDELGLLDLRGVPRRAARRRQDLLLRARPAARRHRGGLRATGRAYALRTERFVAAEHGAAGARARRSRSSWPAPARP